MICAKRSVCLLLCLALALTLLGGLRVWAYDNIWVETPTGWVNWGHVDYHTVTVNNKTYVLNWGVRGERAVFLTEYALDYYATEGTDWAYDLMAELSGGTGAEDAPDSALYGALHSFLVGKQTHVTDYAETRGLYRYTDCMVSDSDSISSFYSGIRLNGAWDNGSTWNREHTWPKSKSSGSQRGDIMMLRPTSVRENSSRGSLAYGESAGFYRPNAEVGSTGLDLRGDCARICLYCYVRWSENVGYMWGAEGVVESLDVLLGWMEADPVDTWELGRNDAVQSITGVRNCFVDYPELAWALFGREIPAAVYPTPSVGSEGWPPAAPAVLEARSCNEEWGTVSLRGWAVDCAPAPGYYASGFDVYEENGLLCLENEAWSRFRWENGRLLYFPGPGDTGCLAELRFTPVGETDPCPAGHAWDGGTVTAPPSETESGVRTYTCTRCGRTRPAEEPWSLPNPFEDVAEGKYYYEPVLWAYYHAPQITSGTDDSHFSPGKACTREQIMTFVWKASGAPAPDSTENPFTDVKPGKYYESAVLWAYSHEPQITGGMNETTFGVGKPCTRAQVVMFLWAAAGRPEPADAENPFTDVDPSAYYHRAVLWALENGVTGGTTPTTFSPKQTCTRAQVVTFLYAAFG